MSRYCLVAAMLLLTVFALGGCGGGYIDDDYYHEDDYPRYTDLTLILRVQTPNGNPLGGATVWIDGDRDDHRTDSEFHPLADGYPRDWWGWLANWVSDEYSVVMSYPGDADEFEMRVSKPGFTADRSTVVVEDWEPDHIFIRDVMTLRRETDTTAPAASEPHRAEVIPGPRLAPRVGPGKLIRSSED